MIRAVRGSEGEMGGVGGVSRGGGGWATWSVVPIETEHTGVAKMGICLGSLGRCGSSASEIA